MAIEDSRSRRILEVEVDSRSGWKLPLAVSIILIAVLAGLKWMGLDASNMAVVGRGAPSFTLPKLGGGEGTLEEHRGKWVILTFWATSSARSRSELKAMGWIYEALREEAFEVLAVSVDVEGIQRIRPFLEQTPLPFTILVDRLSEVAKRYHVQATADRLPVTFVIDPDGTIAGRSDGPIEPMEWAGLLQNTGLGLAGLVLPHTRAPDFTLPRLGGGKVSLSGLAGKWVFVNFWATWCKPCEDEMPAMENLYRSIEDDRFEILAITIDADGEKSVRPFLKKFPVTFPILMDSEGSIAALYQTTGVPETFIIMPGGLIIDKYIGPPREPWDSEEFVTKVRAWIQHGDQMRRQRQATQGEAGEAVPGP